MITHSQGPGQLTTDMKEMLDGLTGLPGGLTSLSVLGVTYTIADFEAKLGGYHGTYAAVVQAEIAHGSAIDARDLVAPEAEAFVAAARAAFKAALGKKAPALKNLGIEPDKTPAPLTTEQQTERIAKAKATRIARHTMGKKAKSKIKGQPPTPPAGP